MGSSLKEFQIRIVAKKEFHSAVQFSAAMYSPRRSHRHKYGQPHIRALSPHTLQVSHGTAPDFLNGLNKHVFSLMAAWLSVFSKMTGQEILI